MTHRAALASAKVAAATARREPTASNVAIARALVLSAMTAWSSAIRNDGPGYNPYRDKSGRFAPGTHKERRPTAAVAKATAAVERAKGKRSAAAEKLKSAKIAKGEAVAHARAALQAAKEFAKSARRSPTPDSLRAAKSATRAAINAKKQVDKHSERVVKRTADHDAARSAHIDAKRARSEARASTGVRVASAKDRQILRASLHSSPLDANARAAADAMTRGDLTAARVAVEAHIGAFGLGVNPAPMHDVAAVPATQIGGASGVHGWDGRILLSIETADALPRFSAMLGGAKMRPQVDLRTEHEALLARRNLIAERARTSQGQVRDRLNKEVQSIEHERMQLFNRLYYDTDAEFRGHVLVHETLHGYSPGTMNAYHGPGAKIEEITTEVTARRVSGDMFGITNPGHDRGSYGEHIGAAVAAISEVTGHPPHVAYQHLEQAAFEYKRRQARSIPSADDVHRAFASDLAFQVGVSTSAMSTALTNHLTPVKGQP